MKEKNCVLKGDVIITKPLSDEFIEKATKRWLMTIFAWKNKGKKLQKFSSQIPRWMAGTAYFQRETKRKEKKN